MSHAFSSPALDLSGVWVPLITPFHETEPHAVNHGALAALARRLVCDGVRGLVVCGTTGEAPALDLDEQRACLRTVAEAAPECPRLMGLGGESMAEALHRLRLFTADALTRPQALLVSAPAYVRPSQVGVRRWFKTLADASPVPLVLYDIPYRTGVTLTRETLLDLAMHPNIVGLKDCGGDLGKTLALLQQGNLQVLAGEDLAAFATVALGGVGTISAAAHLATPHWVAMVAALRAGLLHEARAHWLPLVPLVEALFAEPNPGPLKAALAYRGEVPHTLRPPMTTASPELVARLINELSLLSDPHKLKSSAV